MQNVGMCVVLKRNVNTGNSTKVQCLATGEFLAFCRYASQKTSFKNIILEKGRWHVHGSGTG